MADPRSTNRPDAKFTEAKLISIEEVVRRLDIQGLHKLGGGEWVGPCPVCGGHEKRDSDRFSVNPFKGVFNCRKCSEAGDQIKLVQHVLGIDFPAALTWLVGDGPVEIDEAKQVERRKKLEREEAARVKAQNEYRARAIRDAKEIWQKSRSGSEGVVRAYLLARGIPEASLKDIPVALRFIADFPYVKKIGDRLETAHRGPAMIAGVLDQNDTLLAVHQTWVDPNPPHGKAAISWQGAALPSKMVRGSKKGGAIRLITPVGADTLVMGEGIETTLTAAVCWHDLLPNAAYWAGVDLGNMSGIMLKQKGKRYTELPDLSDKDAFLPPPWVKRLIFIQDGDSNPKATRAKLVCGLRRAQALTNVERIQIVHAGEGVDLNDVLVGKSSDEAKDD